MTNSTPNPKTWAKGEYRKRLAEMAIMFSWILPIYSKESREAFRLTFQEDIAIVFPTFFRDLYTLHKVSRAHKGILGIYQRSYVLYLRRDREQAEGRYRRR